jgi:ribosome-binding factor A
VPELTFRIDESIAYGRKIDRLLDEVKSERRSLDEDEDLF